MRKSLIFSCTNAVIVDRVSHLKLNRFRNFNFVTQGLLVDRSLAKALL